MVSGEAGIGKTRLCREVAARAEGRAFAVAWGSCWPDGGAPPLWPWQSILTTLRGDDAAALLSEDRGGATVDPERFARFAAVTHQLALACGGSPALVVIDDVHAADVGALLLTRFVARTLARVPLVLLLTRRTSQELPDEGSPSWDFASEATPIHLDRFNLAETAEFLRAHGRPALSDDMLQALLRLTGGLPLHLQRVVALGSTDATRPGVPESVETATALAIDRLGSASRVVLSQAAVLGMSPLVAEAAAVSRVTPAAVHRALEDGLTAGLVADAGPERFSFSHETVREALQSRLTVDELTSTHARAAVLVAQPARAEPGQLARIAHHALHAAARSDGDARAAVAACRVAARAMAASYAYEQAEAMLAAAVTLHESAGLGEPDAPLLVERAEAALRCGRLTDARQLFDWAARAAAAGADPVALARAALGLGGLWVNEHRTRLEWERVTGLQRRAMAGLAAQEGALRLRLAVRLAVEDVYRGGPREPVLALLDDARRLGDGYVLAETLSLCHHVLLTPRFLEERMALAEELIAVASPAGAGMLALTGLCWRAVDLFQLGDNRADRALAELKERADAIGCQSLLYIAEAMEVMRLIRAGRLGEAEAAAYACMQLGSEVGDADALGFLGAHLTTIRWLQARDREMLETVEQIASSPTLNPAEFAFEATVASLAARAGHTDKARTALDRLAGAGLGALPESSTWLAGMLAVVETAYELTDAPLAREAYDLVAPYAGQAVMPSLAVTCFGSAERVLGLAAATFGDTDRAIAHLDRALAANRLLGNRPVTAITMADLAEALLRRRGPGDRDRAVHLLTDAASDADTLEMPVRAAVWRQRLEGLTESTSLIESRHGSWVLTMNDLRAVVPDRRGVRYLVRLLTNPGKPIPALVLAAESDDAATVLAQPGRQPVLDQQALAAYRRRIRELDASLVDARSRGDPAAAGRLQAEHDALLEELRHSTGKAGRPREFPDPSERARTAVRKAIKRAIDEVTADEPAIGMYLRATVATGVTCCYTPAPGRAVRWIRHEA